MIWIVALIPLIHAVQLPPRDQNPRAVEAQQGTAMIRGRVVDAETGEPVSRIPVRLSRRGDQRSRVVLSDHEGQFEFATLPAGKYSLVAESSPARAGYLYAMYRNRQAETASESQPPDGLELRDSEVRDDITLSLPRARVITGRVLDDAAEPRAHVQVEAELLDRGRSRMHRMVSTDDLGAFRLFGLSAGRYRVCATTSDQGAPGADAAPQAEGLVKTCYPSTSIESEATPVAVESGNADVEIRLQRSRLFSISGMVLDASGAPAQNASTSLVTIHKHGSTGRSVDMKGATFAARGLSPGKYAIRAQVGDPFDPADSRDRQMAYVPFTVDAGNLENLVVPMKRPATVAGRIVFEGGMPPSIAGLRVRALPDEESEQMQDWGRGPGSPVRDDSTFELKSLFGRYVIALDSLPRGWVVKSVRYRGEDITELPTEFASGPSDLVLVVSNRPARIVARVNDERGNPAGNAIVVLVPADPRAWAVRRNRVRMIYARGAAYEDANLRPGEYYVMAVSSGAAPLLDEREQLEAIAASAQKITFLENDHRIVDLQLVKPAAR